MSGVRARFKLGRLTATSAAVGVISREKLFQLVDRHLRGDWGDVTDEDAKANECAVKNGDRIISWYSAPGGERIMILTEADRSATTVLLAQEY